MPAVLISLIAGLGWLMPEPQAALAAAQGAVSVSAGYAHSCAIESGKAYCWGDNGYGQLGDGGTAASSIPVAVDTSGVLAGKTLTQIAAGYYDTCALDSTGAAYCWGYNASGQLGDGTTNSSSVPVAVDTYGVLAGKTLTQITVGYFHACALDTAGAAYCWGYDNDGELGDGHGGNANSSVPVAVTTSGVLAGKTLTKISAGTTADHTCALDTAGAAYCWGRNVLGELGDGSTTTGYLPVAVDVSGVLAGKALTQITAGDSHTCALDASGAGYCWGDNTDGELGDGSTAGSSIPVAVDASGVLAGKTLIQVTASLSHVCALDAAGAAYCWGANEFGQLGDGNTTSEDSRLPVAVDASGALDGKTLIQVTAGGNYTCGADDAGAIYCWGRNDAGQLGNDSTANSNLAVLAGPQPPTAVTAIGSDSAAEVSWTAPASLDGGTLTGYTATASPGGAACTTSGATMCTITGLSDGTTYAVTVVAHATTGDSGASPPATVTPGPSPTPTSTSPSPSPTPTSPTPTTTSPSPSPTPTSTRPTHHRRHHHHHKRHRHHHQRHRHHHRRHRRHILAGH
jgi:alpha-tubulin suppressor-like RCC1 family protein